MKITNQKYTQYTYIVGKYKIYLYELQKQVEKRNSRNIFWPISRRVQIHFIFTNNVRILCLCCNVKRLKTSTAKLPKNSRNKRCSSSVMVSSITSAFLLLPFHIVALHGSGNRKAISWSVIVNNKKISIQCNLTAQIEPVQGIYLYIYLTGGYDVPKDTMILINHWALHRDPNNWKDIEHFDPTVAKPELHLIFASIFQRFKIDLYVIT